MQSLKVAERSDEPRGVYPNLNDRYGKIGISAVAAAVRFQSETRPQAPATILRFDDSQD